MLIDSHCHLDMLKRNIDETIKNAEENNIIMMQTICTKLEEFDQIYEFAKTYDNIFASVGIHPDEVENSDKTNDEIYQFLIKSAGLEKVIGLGETGLDYYRDKTSENIKRQKEIFRIHIKVAQETGLPIIIHSRSNINNNAAEEDIYSIIFEEYQKSPFLGLIHCFTGSNEFANRMLEIGFYISVSGIITFKNAMELQNIIEKIPLDKLLIETDSPFLTPVPYRGKEENQPAFVKHVASKISELKNIPYAQVAEVTTANFLRLFKISKILTSESGA